MKNQFHPKYHRKHFWISALKFFVVFWRLPGSFLGFQQSSLFMILLTKSTESTKSFKEAPGSYKKFQGRIPEIFSLVFWMKLIFHKDILKLTDLQEVSIRQLHIGLVISTGSLLFCKYVTYIVLLLNIVNFQFQLFRSYMAKLMYQCSPS